MKIYARIGIFPLILMGVFIMFISSCKKEDDNPSAVTDIDGNIYHTVQIGSQVWMVENLKTTRYRNGDTIPNVINDIEWSQLSTDAYCIYNNNADLDNLYGKLYNWYAVSDPQNIAPKGWHIPTDAEWTALENYVSTHVGTSGSVGKALAAPTDWTRFKEVNGVGNDLLKNNSSGFTALPGGNRYANGKDDDVGYIGCWWSSTEADDNTAGSRGIYSYYDTVSRNFDKKQCGLSIRCIKD